MKKFLSGFVLAAVIMAIAAGTVFADGDPRPHFVIGNVAEVSGGGRGMEIFSHFDFLSVPVVRAGEKEANPQAYELYQKHKIYAHGSFTVYFGGKQADSPAAANTIPAAKDGLVNANRPLVIESHSNKIAFSFDQDIAKDYSLRVLDNKGKVLARLGEKDTADIPVTSDAKNYYVEFCEQENGKTGYYYILLKMSSLKTDLPQKELRHARDDIIAYQMKKLNIPDYSQITMIQDKTIYEALRLDIDVREWRKSKEAKSVLDTYMKDHRVTDYRDLTSEDGDVLRFLQMVVPYPRGKETLDQYMKSHNIKDVKDLTDEDRNNIAGLMAQPGIDVMNRYMEEHGVSNMDEMTDAQKMDMAFEAGAQMAEDEDQRKSILTAQDVMNKYMREHNITNPAALTAKDQKAIQNEIVKSQIQSMPPAQRAVVDKYMKDHKIRDYGDLTEKDFNAIEKLLNAAGSKKKGR